jgi:hypothetical protein
MSAIIIDKPRINLDTKRSPIRRLVSDTEDYIHNLISKPSSFLEFINILRGYSNQAIKSGLHIEWVKLPNLEEEWLYEALIHTTKNSYSFGNTPNVEFQLNPLENIYLNPILHLIEAKEDFVLDKPNYLDYFTDKYENLKSWRERFVFVLLSQALKVYGSNDYTKASTDTLADCHGVDLIVLGRKGEDTIIPLQIVGQKEPTEAQTYKYNANNILQVRIEGYPAYDELCSVHTKLKDYFELVDSASSFICALYSNTPTKLNLWEAIDLPIHPLETTTYPKYLSKLVNDLLSVGTYAVPIKGTKNIALYSWRDNVWKELNVRPNNTIAPNTYPLKDFREMKGINENY